MSELAGRLAERVTLERWQGLRDAAGDDVGEWIALGHAHAELRPEGGLAATSAGETRRSSRRWRVVLRDSDDLGLDLRLRWRGVVLVVLALGRDPAAPGLVTLLCEGRQP